jgi:hypothetical protein
MQNIIFEQLRRVKKAVARESEAQGELFDVKNQRSKILGQCPLKIEY